jgi:biotin operon repressor
VAAIIWVASRIPAVWQVLVPVVGGFWEIIASTVPVPIWLLLLAIAMVILRVRVLLGRKVTSDQRAIATHTPPAATEPDFNEIESTVIQALARADGDWLSLEALSGELGRSRLVVEQAVESLVNTGFVIYSRHPFHGTSFRLSQTGRDFAIRRGYVKRSP